MNHWLLDVIAKKRVQALRKADWVQFHREIMSEEPVFDTEVIQEVVTILELVVLDVEPACFVNGDESCEILRAAAADAFHLLRALPLSEVPTDAATQLLRASVLAVIGDRDADVARWLRALKEEQSWPSLPLGSLDWGERCRATLVDVWLCLVHRQGWSDCDVVLKRVAALRAAQQEFERGYLESFKPVEAKRPALELIAIYHLARAAEVLSHYVTDGAAEDCCRVQRLMDSHFDHAIAACGTGYLFDLEALARLLACAAMQMARTRCGLLPAFSIRGNG